MAYSINNNTAYLFAQAHSAQDGGTGSKDAPIPGDQIGCELDAVTYYRHAVGWGKVYRLNNESQRETLARFMEDCVLNGWIGYDDQHRNELESALAAVGYNPNRIAWACSADCSMLAYEAVKAATGVDVNGYAAPIYYLSGTKYPHVQSFDYYMERILPLNGIGVTVYTVSNYLNGVIRRSGTVVANDPANSVYLYESAYDDKTQYLYDYNYGVEIGHDVANGTLAEENRANNRTRNYGAAGAQLINDNLTVNIGEDYLTYLTSADNLIRGDLIRTRSPAPSGGHGHIACWI